MRGWIVALIVLGGAVLAVGTMLVLRRLLGRLAEHRAARYQNDLLARHVEEVQNIYHQMRGWRHDYHNHIQTIKAFLEMDRLDELGGYLDRLNDDLDRVDTTLKTGNLHLDAILNSKLSLIANRGIRVNAKAQVPSTLTVTDVDLCVILGNLLDNAMESCERLPPGDDRFIRVYVGVMGEQLYLSVTNAAAAGVRKLGRMQYQSEKGGSHGFGLSRVDALVARYGGYLNRQSEPGVFATEILLPL